MTEDQNQVQYPDDEITLKELILKLQEFYREVLKNWKLFILFAIPVFAIGLYSHFTKEHTYTATLTFMIEEEGGGGGAMAGILGSFGLGGSKSSYNLDKILELSRSRKIVQMALFEQDTLNGKTDYFANHLIDIYDFHEKWKKADPPLLKDFYFSADSVELFNRNEYSALKALHGKVIGNAELDIEGIYASSINEETGIMTLKMETLKESISINFLERLYYNLKKFYVEKSIEKQEFTYNIVKRKTDSLELALNSAQYRLLKFQDANRNLGLRQFESQRLQLEREATALAMAYGEAMKNLEMADFALKSKTPFIQEIDLPIPPIRPNQASLLKQLVILGFLTGFLAGVFIVGRKIIRDAMV